ncbi:MAG: hypothetical protein B6D58_00650 [candidate division Zixibacteria bacterium 4484_95]|nr:MAG: hypothetical protein B6D58_00650 [candidate division Zixibacteria bacterium 4484_95]RKX18366.1 MAG: complex I NDUFA9 subunit family protein [candidate division Zixibacteria bacterium]
MNVAIAGGTGFIGKVIIKMLTERNHHVVVLTRPGSAIKIARFSGTETRYTYYDTPSQVEKSLADCQAIINLVGIIRETKDTPFEYVHNLIPSRLATAALEVGIKRFLQMSALGVDSALDVDYMLTKKQGENAIKKTSGLEWTIFRPSIVFGPDDMFVNMLARMIKLLPVIPVIGDGTYRLQPVSVFNVAEGFVKSLVMPKTIGKTYDVAGPDKYSFNKLLDIIAIALGKKRVRKFHQPLPLVKPVVKFFGRFQSFPITTDQIKMLCAENVTDNDSFFKELDIVPIDFASGIKEYIEKSSR